jgi:uncharacterized protein YrrD
MVMLFKEDAKVVMADGTSVGSVDRVVLDPRTKAVTHLVVRKGLIFNHDKVIPVNLINTATEELVTLSAEAGDLQALPAFEVTHYVTLTPEDISIDYTTSVAQPLFWYPPAVWSAYTVQTTRNIPLNTIALREGARVISKDDKYMGDVEQVFANPNSAEATHFVISKGLLLKERKLIPTAWVTGFSEDEVRLAVSGNLMQRLRPYEEPARTSS